MDRRGYGGLWRVMANHLSSQLSSAPQRLITEEHRMKIVLSSIYHPVSFWNIEQLSKQSIVNYRTIIEQWSPIIYNHPSTLLPYLDVRSFGHRAASSRAIFVALSLGVLRLVRFRRMIRYFGLEEEASGIMVSRGNDPRGSMYAIYGNIYHQYTPNVSIYTIHGSYGDPKIALIISHMFHVWNLYQHLPEQNHPVM